MVLCTMDALASLATDIIRFSSLCGKDGEGPITRGQNHRDREQGLFSTTVQLWLDYVKRHHPIPVATLARRPPTPSRSRLVQSHLLFVTLVDRFQTPPWSTYALKSGSLQPSPVSASAKSGLILPSRQRSPMPTLVRMSRNSSRRAVSSSSPPSFTLVPAHATSLLQSAKVATPVPVNARVLPRRVCPSKCNGCEDSGC